MSGLVGYESSSEDEKDETRAVKPLADPTPTAIQTHEELSNGHALHKDVATTDVLIASGGDAPMVGPSMPPGSSQEIGERTDATSPIPSDLSERATIRFLTQATHPITSLPPSPPGSPDPAAGAMFKRFLQLKAQGHHFNQDLASKSTFRNPNLLSALMARAGLEEDDQYVSSLPTSLGDPSRLPDSVYKEGLLKSQTEIKEKEEALKKAQSSSGKRTLDFVPSTSSTVFNRELTPGQQHKRKRP